jgi:hypothetical protein
MKKKLIFLTAIVIIILWASTGVFAHHLDSVTDGYYTEISDADIENFIRNGTDIVWNVIVVARDNPTHGRVIDFYRCSEEIDIIYNSVYSRYELSARDENNSLKTIHRMYYSSSSITYDNVYFIDTDLNPEFIFNSSDENFIEIDKTMDGKSYLVGNVPDVSLTCTSTLGNTQFFTTFCQFYLFKDSEQLEYFYYDDPSEYIKDETDVIDLEPEFWEQLEPGHYDFIITEFSFDNPSTMLIMYDMISFDVIEQLADITMIEEGATYYDLPDNIEFIVEESAGSYFCFFINGEYRYDFEGTGTHSTEFLELHTIPSGHNEWMIVNENDLTLYTVTFTLVEQYEPDIPDMPQLSDDSDFFEKVTYYVEVLFYYIEEAFNLLTHVIETAASYAVNFKDIFADLVAFMPNEWVTIGTISLGFGLAMKMFRR